MTCRQFDEQRPRSPRDGSFRGNTGRKVGSPSSRGATPLLGRDICGLPTGKCDSIRAGEYGYWRLLRLNLNAVRRNLSSIGNRRRLDVSAKSAGSLQFLV